MVASALDRETAHVPRLDADGHLRADVVLRGITAREVRVDAHRVAIHVRSQMQPGNRPMKRDRVNYGRLAGLAIDVWPDADVLRREEAHHTAVGARRCRHLE